MEKELCVPYEDLLVPCKVYESGYGAVTRVIIGVHGLTGNKDIPILASIREEMGLYQAATISFDLPGHGASSLSTRDLSLENCRKSLMAAVSLARELYPEVSELCFFAECFGAYITLLAVDELLEQPERIKLVLRAPSVRMAETLLNMIEVNQAQFLKEGRVSRGYDKVLELSYSFYEEIAANSVMTSYDTPMLIIHGELDEYVHLADLELFRRLNNQAKLVVFPGADHHFRTEAEQNMLVDLVRDWSLCEEVLLSDWS